MNQPIAAHPTFGGDEVDSPDLADARIVVLPVCYENAVSYGTGSRDGAMHILEASAQMEALDDESLVPWVNLGIHTLPPLSPDNDPETAVEQIRTAAAPVFRADQFLLTLGGDHAVSIGTIRAAAERFPGIGVLQVDAHLDLRDNWNGSRFNHACVMRRVVEDMGLPVIPVGTRSVAAEELDVCKRRGISPMYAHEIGSSGDAWLEPLRGRLPDPLYLTIDLDGLDPSVIPGTGTPEPGGLSYRQMLSLIRMVSEQTRVIGADIVELAKIPGTQVSEYTAARIAQKVMSICWNTSE